MPRQYDYQPQGPATPDPMNVGTSGDINLPTPIYRPQLGVDPGVNVFAELNQILGLGAQAFSGFMDLESNKIRSNIALASDKMQNLERAKAEQRRLEAEARYEIRAAKAEEREALAEQRRLEQEEKERLFDEITAERAKHSSSISELTAAGDADTLTNYRASLIRSMKEEPNPKKKQALSDLADEATTKINTLQSKQDAQLDEIERANTNRAFKLASSKAQVIVDQYRGDPAVIESMIDKSPDTVRKTIKEQVVDSISRDPEYQALYKDVPASSKEWEAINDGIDRVIDDAVNSVLSEQTRRAKIIKNNTMVDSLEAEARDGNYEAAKRQLEDSSDTMTGAQLARYSKQLADNFISGARSNIDRLNRANVLISSQDPVEQSIGYMAIRDVQRKIATDLEIQRSTPDVIRQGDATYPAEDLPVRGWRRTYDKYSDLQDDVLLQKFGMDPATFNPNEAPEIVAKTIEYLQESWNTDTKATNEAFAAVERRAKLVDKTAKKTLSAREVFNGTVLGQAISSGTWTQMNPVEMRMALEEATVGFMDGAVPDPVLDIVKTRTADPTAFVFISEFWGLHGPGQNPNIAAKVADDPALRDSMLLGIYLRTKLSDPRTSPAQLGNEASMFMTNLKYITSPNITAQENNDPKAVEIRDRAIAAVDQMLAAPGDKSRIGWFDGLGFSSKTMLSTMDPADIGVLTHFAAMSAALDPATDKVQFMRKALEVEGYQFILNKDKTKVDMIWNGSNRNNERTLPHTTVLESKDWDYYLRSKAIEWVGSLGNRVTVENVRENPYSINSSQLIDDIKNGKAKIELIPNPLDMYNGYSTYQIILPNGETYRPSLMEAGAGVSNKDFAEWSKSSSANQLKRDLTRQEEKEAMSAVTQSTTFVTF